MSPINTPPEGHGSLNLYAWAHIMGAWRKCLVVEADGATQTARLIISGSLVNCTVTFNLIQNVALCYDDGTVVRSFGAPRQSNPASLEYIQATAVQ